MRTSSGWRAALRAVAASAVIVTAPLMAATPAFAQYGPPPPSLSLSTTTVAPGGTLGFTGTGFEDGQTVVALLLSKKVVLGRFTADSEGTVEGTVTIPKRTEPGWHTFKLKAHDPDLVLSEELRVKARHHHPHLADTGDNDSLILIGGAAGLALIGGGATLAARRLKRD